MKILVRNSDKRVLSVATDGSGLDADAGETVYSGTISHGLQLSNCEWDTGTSSVIDRGKWFHLYVTSDSTTCQANGSSTVSITVQKRKWDDTNMNDASDNDNVQIGCTRGLLNATSGNLVNGTKTFILTSVAESVESIITASVTTGLLDSGDVTVTFVP